MFILSLQGGGGGDGAEVEEPPGGASVEISPPQIPQVFGHFDVIFCIDKTFRLVRSARLNFTVDLINDF